jgi:hypothetical protein
MLTRCSAPLTLSRPPIIGIVLIHPLRYRLKVTALMLGRETGAGRLISHIRKGYEAYVRVTHKDLPQDIDTMILNGR